MTILLHDYRELEERASRHLNVWKAWHLILYLLAAIFGILNYVFLRNTMHLVGNNCVLFPRQLSFTLVALPSSTTENNDIVNATLSIDNTDGNVTNSVGENAQDLAVLVGNATDGINDRSIQNDIISNGTEGEGHVFPGSETSTDTTLNENVDLTIPSSVNESRLMLDTSRALFGYDSDCQFAEYMPIVSTIFALTWITFFIMCPGGGYSRSGLQQPWRILTPALLFALVMVGLTGHSFTSTNSGLYTFCSAFYNITNSTTCSSVNRHLALRPSSWSFGARVSATRAASAGVWASWACGAALLLARCLAAPDFRVKRTAVFLKDPQKKITPYLKKTSRKRNSNNSPDKRDMTSSRSEQTLTTELVTASIEREQDDTAPTSPQLTPIRLPDGENIEMTTTPRPR